MPLRLQLSQKNRLRLKFRKTNFYTNFTLQTNTSLTSLAAICRHNTLD